MSVKIEFDKNAFKQTVKQQAAQALNKRTFDVECPHCHSEVKVPTGQNPCPKCGNIIIIPPSGQALQVISLGGNNHGKSEKITQRELERQGIFSH